MEKQLHHKNHLYSSINKLTASFVTSPKKSKITENSLNSNW